MNRRGKKAMTTPDRPTRDVNPDVATLVADLRQQVKALASQLLDDLGVTGRACVDLERAKHAATRFMQDAADRMVAQLAPIPRVEAKTPVVCYRCDFPLSLHRDGVVMVTIQELPPGNADESPWVRRVYHIPCFRAQDAPPLSTTPKEEED